MTLLELTLIFVRTQLEVKQRLKLKQWHCLIWLNDSHCLKNFPFNTNKSEG